MGESELKGKLCGTETGVLSLAKGTKTATANVEERIDAVSERTTLPATRCTKHNESDG
ncbi:hypothetical protein [Haladaptatus sp. DFWS20]|uniref:hypothetical protein n=1 Tax=Haladaptatus sp. DFWS20 TaxID=3403467 RepID=UPI003EBF595C